MSIEVITEGAPQPEKKKGGKKEMQLEKMRLSTEKLQFSRIRATLTLIALGFGVYKLFYVRMENGQKPLVEFFTGRDLGMILISIGLVMLTSATAQHTKSIAKLRLRYKDMPASISLYLSYGILLLSLFLLFITISRL